MEQYLQGDIFKAINEHQIEVGIVFGHIGFNNMSSCWQEFAQSVPSLAQVRDPFLELSGGPIEVQERRWLWFVPAGENNGLTNSQLDAALRTALTWASGNKVKTVITNGIANTDHSHDSAANRDSDDNRAQFLMQCASDYGSELRINITLISLNDVFLRNAA